MAVLPQRVYARMDTEISPVCTRGWTYKKLLRLAVHRFMNESNACMYVPMPISYLE